MHVQMWPWSHFDVDTQWVADRPHGNQMTKLEIKKLLNKEYSFSADVKFLIMASLTPREQSVITLRYGLDYKGFRTLHETAAELKVSHEGVRKIEQRAIRYLKDTLLHRPTKKELAMV